MKRITLGIIALVLVCVAVGAFFVLRDDGSNGTTNPPSVATTLVPTLKDSCNALDAHEAAANDAYNQAEEAATTAYEKAITEIDPEDGNVSGKVKEITETRDNAIEAAEVTKTNALADVKTNRDLCTAAFPSN